MNEKDYVKAVNWCTLSAERGFDGALLALGHLHLAGETKDLHKAEHWYLRYARSGYEGYGYGFAMLGSVAMELGDKVSAYKWYYLCSKSDYAGCQTDLIKLKSELSGSDIDNATKQAKEWSLAE